MDNITHSLTGALAAKLVTAKLPAERKSQRRTIFWLLVVSANFPDIDVAQSLFSDYLTYIVSHRGITHSFLFAPMLALVPAGLFWRFSAFKNLKALWMTATIGIFIHIFFDLITSFGTMIFLPISDKRYALDWMFIIDPFFTGLLALILLFGRILKTYSTIVIRLGVMLVLSYLTIEAASHAFALRKLESSLADKGISSRYVSALPQPFNIFRWNGLAQTQDGVVQAFYSVFDDSLALTHQRSMYDEFVQKAMQQDQTSRYLTFARHPLVSVSTTGGERVVELRDMQFSIDAMILQMFDRKEAPPPFVFRYTFAADGTIKNVLFDGKILPH